MNIKELRNTNKRNSLDLMKKQFRFNDIINRNNSKKHERKKVNMALDYVFEDCEVYPEAKLINGGIADLFISDLNKCNEDEMTCPNIKVRR